MMQGQQTIDSLKRATAEYSVLKDLGIKKTDEDTKNIMSGTYGKFIKNDLELPSSPKTTGLNPNVNMAYQNAMLDPNNKIEVNGYTHYISSAVGNLTPTNPDGEQTYATFTFHAVG